MSDLHEQLRLFGLLSGEQTSDQAQANSLEMDGARLHLTSEDATSFSHQPHDAHAPSHRAADVQSPSPSLSDEDVVAKIKAGPSEIPPISPTRNYFNETVPGPAGAPSGEGEFGGGDDGDDEDDRSWYEWDGDGESREGLDYIELGERRDDEATGMIGSVGFLEGEEEDFDRGEYGGDEEDDVYGDGGFNEDEGPDDPMDILDELAFDGQADYDGEMWFGEEESVDSMRPETQEQLQNDTAHPASAPRRKRKRRSLEESSRRVQPRRSSTLERTFKDVYGVGSFWSGGESSIVKFETELISLPTYRNVEGLSDIEDEIEALKKKRRIRVKQSEFTLSINWRPPLGETSSDEGEFDAAGHPFVRRPRTSEELKEQRTEVKTAETRDIDDLLHAESELPRFTALLSAFNDSDPEEDISDQAFIRRHWRLELTERYNNILKGPFVDDQGVLRLPTEEDFEVSEHRQTYNRSPYPTRVPPGMWRPSPPLPEYIPIGLPNGPEVLMPDPVTGTMLFSTLHPLPGEKVGRRSSKRGNFKEGRSRRGGPGSRGGSRPTPRGGLRRSRGGRTVAVTAAPPSMPDIPLFISYDWKILVRPVSHSKSVKSSTCLSFIRSPRSTPIPTLPQVGSDSVPIKSDPDAMDIVQDTEKFPPVGSATTADVQASDYPPFVTASSSSAVTSQSQHSGSPEADALTSSRA